MRCVFPRTGEGGSLCLPRSSSRVNGGHISTTLQALPPPQALSLPLSLPAGEPLPPVSLGEAACRQACGYTGGRCQEGSAAQAREDRGGSQFSLVAQSCPTVCDPMDRSTPCPPVHHQLLESTQTHVHRVSDAIQPSHPLSSPSPPAPNPSQHQGLVQ